MILIEGKGFLVRLIVPGIPNRYAVSGGALASTQGRTCRGDEADWPGLATLLSLRNGLGLPNQGNWLASL